MYYLLLVLLRKTKLSNTSKTKNNNNRNKQTEAQAQRWGGWAPGASDKLSWLVGGRARRGRCPDGIEWHRRTSKDFSVSTSGTKILAYNKS